MLTIICKTLQHTMTYLEQADLVQRFLASLCPD